MKMGELSKLPNIGAALEQRLTEAGVETPEQLRKLGAREAFLRIRRIDSGACLHMLSALEGAVEGIPKKDLSPEVKAGLKEFFYSEGT